MNSKLRNGVALFGLLFGATLLITGSNWLLIPLINKPLVPLGSISTEIAFFCLSYLVMQFTSRMSGEQLGTFFKIAGTLSMVLSLAWLPLGRYLSGNWSNSFTNNSEASEIFWTFTYAVVALPLLLLLLYLLYRLWVVLFRK